MNKNKEKKTGVLRTIFNLFLFAITMVVLLVTVWWKKVKEKKQRTP